MDYNDGILDDETLIEGLRIRVTSEELATHLRARADYHSERAEQKQQELPALRASVDAIMSSPNAENVARMSGKSGYNFNPHDAVENLERDIRDHRNKALAFRYFADHLFTQDYDLGEEDLQRIEILKSFR